MCLEERNTDSRARPLVTFLIVPRTRLLRRVACFLGSAIAGLLLLLAFLAEDELTSVLHALALVGLGLAEPANFGRDLADLLFVDPGHHHFGGLGRGNRDAFGNRVDHVVAVAERDLQVLALHRSAIADAAD